jgi:hypothetical protein
VPSWVVLSESVLVWPAGRVICRLGGRDALADPCCGGAGAGWSVTGYGEGAGDDRYDIGGESSAGEGKA